MQYFARAIKVTSGHPVHQMFKNRYFFLSPCISGIHFVLFTKLLLNIPAFQLKQKGLKEVVCLFTTLTKQKE